MSRVVAQLAAYNEACALRRELLKQAGAWADIVMNAAIMLEQEPVRWRFGNAAAVRAPRASSQIGTVSVDPATWPAVDDLLVLQQEYMRASALETAAFVVLPAAWKPPR
jgi:hypothetical protein